MTDHPETLLLEAYKQASGLPVSMSYAREVALSALVKLGVTPQDITNVVTDVKDRIRRQEKGYTDRSIAFSNLVLNPDAFEERMLQIRMKKLRRPKPLGEQPEQREIGPDKITYLNPVTTTAEPTIVNPAAALRGLANEIKRQA